MKKKLFTPLGVFLLILTLSISAYAAYRIVTIVGQLGVQEAISIVEVPSFQVNLYPQESTSQIFTLKNDSSLPLTVSLGYICNPSEGQNLKITVPNNVEVPAQGQNQFVIQIEAKKSCVPGSWDIEVYVER